MVIAGHALGMDPGWEMKEGFQEERLGRIWGDGERERDQEMRGQEIQNM